MTRSDTKPVRLFYVDDSGAERSGFATFSWIELAIDDWNTGLGEVLNWREHLDHKYGIPKRYELHSTDFVNGRGNPSRRGDQWNRRKAHRSQVMEESFNRFSLWPWLSVGTVYSHTELKRDDFARERARVYQELIQMLDRRLQADGELGLLVMDGDGTDSSYYAAHRALQLETRALIEDPGFQHSHRSQWVQIADLVAYSSYQSLVRLPEKEFAWGWSESLAQRILGVFEV
jgi:hypothetical protein